MRYCTNCGHELGVGRFCTNCGHPIERGSDTAERPSVSNPPPARFPLYAEAEPAGEPSRRTGPWLTWLAVAVALLVVAGLGFWLLTRGTDEADDTAAPDTTTSASPKPDEKPSPSTDPVAQPGETAASAEVAVPATDPPGQDV